MEDLNIRFPNRTVFGKIKLKAFSSFFHMKFVCTLGCGSKQCLLGKFETIAKWLQTCTTMYVLVTGITHIYIIVCDVSFPAAS